MKSTAKYGFTLCCLLAVVAMLCACTRYDDRLRAADAVMEDDPARALEMLDSIHASTLADNDCPYYSLLYTQAQVKNNIVVDNDSLIAVAYDAYAHASGNSDLKKRANFYNAQVAYYAKDYRTAMRDILPAYEIAKSQNDPYWTAKAAEIIGDIYFDLYNYGNAEKFKRESADKYKEASLIRSHRYALCDLNACLMNEGKETEALRMIDSLHTAVVSEVPLDTTLYEYVKMSLYSFYSKTGQTEKLNKLLEEDSKMDANDEVTMDLAIVSSNALNNQGRTDEAELYLTKAANIASTEIDRTRVLYASFRQSLVNKDFEKAAPLGDTLLHLQTLMTNELIDESVSGVQTDFYLVQAEASRREARTFMWLIIGLSVLIIMAVAMLSLYYRMKMRKKNSRLETLLASINSYENALKENVDDKSRMAMELTDKSKEVVELQLALEAKNKILDAKNKEISEYQSKYNHRNETIPVEEINDLFRDKWKALSMLCKAYYENENDSDSSRQAVLNKIGKEIRRQTTPEQLAETEAMVDKYMGGVMTVLRSELPDLSEDNYKFASLLFAGAETNLICLLMECNPSAFYKRRKRLLNTIEESEAPHKEMLCEKIMDSQKM